MYCSVSVTTRPRRVKQMHVRRESPCLRLRLAWGGRKRIAEARYLIGRNLPRDIPNEKPKEGIQRPKTVQRSFVPGTYLVRSDEKQGNTQHAAGGPGGGCRKHWTPYGHTRRQAQQTIPSIPAKNKMKLKTPYTSSYVSFCAFFLPVDTYVAHPQQCPCLLLLEIYTTSVVAQPRHTETLHCSTGSRVDNAMTERTKEKKKRRKEYAHHLIRTGTR